MKIIISCWRHVHVFVRQHCCPREHKIARNFSTFDKTVNLHPSRYKEISFDFYECYTSLETFHHKTKGHKACEADFVTLCFNHFIVREEHDWRLTSQKHVDNLNDIRYLLGARLHPLKSDICAACTVTHATHDWILKRNARSFDRFWVQLRMHSIKATLIYFINNHIRSKLL